MAKNKASKPKKVNKPKLGNLISDAIDKAGGKKSTVKRNRKAGM